MTATRRSTRATRGREGAAAGKAAAPEVEAPSAPERREDEDYANELLAAVEEKRREDGSASAGREGIEWRTNWEPSSGLPDALTSEAAARESFEAMLKARNEEGFRKQKAIKAHAEIPEQEITPEVKRDFRLLKLRGVMDPKRFYKGSDEPKIPKRFHWGTVVEGPTEFYSSRMTKKTRKQNLTEEILGDEAVTAYRKRKFGELQAEAKKSATRQGKQAKRKPRKRPSHKGFRG